MVHENENFDDTTEDDEEEMTETEEILARIQKKLDSGECRRIEMESFMIEFDRAIRRKYKSYCNFADGWNQANPTEEPLETVSFQEFCGANRR